MENRATNARWWERKRCEALVRAGCRLTYAFMTLSFFALVVLPELHVSDKGLVGVGEQGFGFVELIARV
jgi:adenine deaminase